MKAGRLFLLLLLFVLGACEKPSEYSYFIHSDEVEGGPYVFLLDNPDSLNTYDLSFYTGAGCEYGADVRLDLIWIAPDRSIFKEKVYLQPTETAGSVQLYRSGIRPGAVGQWVLLVNVIHAPEFFPGLGIVSKCTENGTR